MGPGAGRADWGSLPVEGGLEVAIVDPADTRPLLCEWAEQAYASLPSVLPKRDMRP